MGNERKNTTEQRKILSLRLFTNDKDSCKTIEKDIRSGMLLKIEKLKERYLKPRKD